MLEAKDMGDDATQNRRAEIGHDLEQALETLVFSLEHGLPRATLNRLDQLAEELCGHLGRDSALFDDLRQFHSAVARVFREPDAIDALLLHGKRLVALLVPRAS